MLLCILRGNLTRNNRLQFAIQIKDGWGWAKWDVENWSDVPMNESRGEILHARSVQAGSRIVIQAHARFVVFTAVCIEA